MEKKKIINELDNQSDYTGFTKFDAPIIHTMPRRFINAKEAGGSENHRGMGVLILGIGIITLIAGAVFVYFYVFNPKLFTETFSFGDTGDTNNTSDISENSVEKNTILDLNTADESTTMNTTSDDALSQINNEENANQQEKSEDDMLINIDDNVSSTSNVEEIGSSSDLSSVVIETPEEKSQEYFPASDADLDGLSDVEELLLGTSNDTVDSDDDGFSDFAELKNLYNPAGEGKLIVNTGIKKYTNKTLGYSLYYPSSWIVNDAGSNENVVFKIDDLQFVQIIITDNPEKKSIEDWYKEQFEVSSIKNEQKVGKSAWEGVKNDSGLIYYLLKPSQDKIFVINYNVGSDNILFYNNIFLLMVESLEL